MGIRQFPLCFIVCCANLILLMDTIFSCQSSHLVTICCCRFQTCYVCEDYKEEVKVYEQNPREFVQNVDLKGYDLPQGTYT